jgi:hypothetical protein
MRRQVCPAHINAAQHSTAQHSTAQHSTAQHSTAQHSTARAPPCATFTCCLVGLWSAGSTCTHAGMGSAPDWQTDGVMPGTPALHGPICRQALHQHTATHVCEVSWCCSCCLHPPLASQVEKLLLAEGSKLVMVMVDSSYNQVGPMNYIPSTPWHPPRGQGVML